MTVAASVSRPAEDVGRDLKRGAAHAEAIGAMVGTHDGLQGRSCSLEL